MKWKTRMTEMMGTEYPIIMGAFAVLGTADFAAPFSNAGGLGIITALNYKNPKAFQKEIDKMNELTDKPYGINFTITPPYGSRLGNPEEHYLEFIDIANDAGVKVITTSAYQAPRIGKIVKDSGCYWVHKCATMKHALAAERTGADAVTIVGLEGTGFKNPYQNTTLINMTMAKKLLKVPIIAAGGIGDARGFLGALAMGADAVCFGTAIMSCTESPSSEKYKQKLITQDIYEEEYYKKIYHLELKDSPIGSMALGHCDEIISLKEFIKFKIIKNAEKILLSWGFKGDTINFSSQ